MFFFFAYRAWVTPGTDYEAYYRAGARALQGEDLYRNEVTPFKYHPVVAYLFVPFAFLPFQVSKFAFFLLSFSVGALVYRGIQKRWGHWTTVAVLIFMLRFHNSDFLNSQVNHLLLIFWLGYLSLRPANWVLATFSFAVFASFKLIPFLVVVPLIFMKRYQEILGIFAWFLILSLLPVLFFKNGALIYLSWFDLLRETAPAPMDTLLQSVPCALSAWVGRFFSQPTWFLAFSYGVQVGLVAVLCAFASQAKTENQRNSAILISVLLSVLLSPMAWKHNYLLLLPVVVFLLDQRRIWTLVVAFVFMTGVSAMLGPSGKDWVDQSYLLVMGGLILMGGLLSIRDETRFS